MAGSSFGMTGAQRVSDPEGYELLRERVGLNQPPVEPPVEAPPETGPLPPLESTAERDWQEEMNRAREQSDKVRMLSQVGKIGSGFVQSMANPKRAPDMSFYDGLDKEAALPEARVKEDMTLDKLARAARDERDKKDPNSAANRRARAMFATTAPHVAKLLGDRFEGLTEADLDRGFKQYMDAARSQREAEALDETKGQHRASNELNAYEATHKILGGAGMGGAIEDARNERQGRTEAINYTKRTKQLTDVLSKMESLNRIAPNLIKGTTVNLPPDANYTELDNAFRKLPGGVGFRLSGQQAQEVKAHVRYIFENMARIAAGANFTDSEQKFYDELFGNGVAAPPEYQAKMLNMLRTSIANHLWHDASNLRAFWPDIYLRALKGGAVGWEHPLLRDVPVDRFEGDALPQPQSATKFSGTPGGGGSGVTEANAPPPVSPKAEPTPNSKGEFTKDGKIYKTNPKTGETRVWDGKKWAPLGQGSK